MPPAPVLLPSVLDLCPQLRPRAGAATIELRRLVAAVAAAFPDAALLVRDPQSAEYLDTTPYDHVAAQVIASAHALSDALSALQDPL
jgi:hypothetical protein